MLTTNQYEKHLGDVRFGEEHKFTYTITNSGDKYITINRMVAGCGQCTTAFIPSNVLSPGQTLPVQVVYTPNNTGQGLKKNLSIEYSYAGDTTSQTMVLSFKSNVSEPASKI